MTRPPDLPFDRIVDILRNGGEEQQHIGLAAVQICDSAEIALRWFRQHDVAPTAEAVTPMGLEIQRRSEVLRALATAADAAADGALDQEDRS